MSVRTIAVRLKLEMQDFNRQMAQAAEATRKGAADIDRNGQKIQTSLGKMARSMEVNREAWMRAGGALTAYGVALGGVAVAILKTGISYNTLQQSSRAALKTVLGTAEAVNEQMRQLDEFARTSPFAKQVFLTAQQQMLAFGIETQKVIPYLDAIQNAVAAAGGNNQTLTELAQIISKIHAAGKLTAQDFIEFGNRGVDAATLIGSQMGKTGAEIRESVTKGLIGADEALDALIAGMDQKFDGAADNVKSTYVGALDRVKAAWRDFASELATPLVDPEGGGLLVDMLNGLADAMRRFQGLPDGVKHAISVFALLTGAVSALGGAFLLLMPRIAATKAAFETLNISMSKIAKGGGTVGLVVVALGALTAAVEALPSATRKGTLGVEETTKALLEMDDAAQSLTGVFDFSDDIFGVTGGVDDLTDAALRLTSPSLVNRMQDVGGSIRGIFGKGDTSRTRAIDQIGELGDALASLVQSGHADVAATKFEQLRRQWEAGGGTVEELKSLMPGYSAALAAVDNEQKLMAESGAKTAEQMQAEADAIKAAEQALAEYHAALSNASTAFIDAEGAYQAVIDKQRELAQATADATKSSKDSMDTYFDGHTVRVKDYIKEVEDQVKARQKWRENSLTLADRVNSDVAGAFRDDAKAMIDALVQQGPSSAPLLEMLAGASDSQLNRIAELWSKGGTEASNEFAQAFDEALNPTVKPTLDMLNASREYGNWVKDVSKQVIVAQVEFQTGGVTKGGGGGAGQPRKYAAGGVHGEGLAWVGETGPELRHFSESGRIYNSAQSRDMLAAAVRSAFTPTPSYQQAPQVVTVPVQSTHTATAPVIIQSASFAQPGDAGMAALDRLNRKSGGR